MYIISISLISNIHFLNCSIDNVPELNVPLNQMRFLSLEQQFICLLSCPKRNLSPCFFKALIWIASPVR